ATRTLTGVVGLTSAAGVADASSLGPADGSPLAAGDASPLGPGDPAPLAPGAPSAPATSAPFTSVGTSGPPTSSIIEPRPRPMVIGPPLPGWATNVSLRKTLSPAGTVPLPGRRKPAAFSSVPNLFARWSVRSLLPFEPRSALPNAKIADFDVYA